MRVSHETIYRSLFIQARGVLKKELMQHLRSKRLIRRSRHARAGGKSQGQIVDAIAIRERPAEIEDRAIPGHWEGDLLAGTSNSHIATLVERHSRFTILVKVPSKDTATVVAALSRQVRKLPASVPGARQQRLVLFDQLVLEDSSVRSRPRAGRRTRHRT
jgi:IS30 family transposase